MKICILTLPRTSSTNLLYTIRDLMGYENYISEPFNNTIWNTKYKRSLDFTNVDDLIIKEMYVETHIPHQFKTLDETFEWYLNTFEKLIFLYRENFRLQAESFMYHLKMKERGVWLNWHSKKYYDMNFVTEEDIIKYMNNLNEWVGKLKNLSTKHNIPIYKYEDLIINNGDNESFKNICEYLNCEYKPDIISNHYHSTRKYRQEKPKINGLI